MKRKAPRAARNTRRIRRRFGGARRVLRPIRSKLPMVAIKRTFWASNWSPNTATTAGFFRYLSFTFNQLPNILEYQNLFEAYRLSAVKVTFRPRYDAFDGANTTDTTLPGVTNQGGAMVHYVVDPWATAGPAGTYTSTTLNGFLESGNVKTYQGNKPFSIYIPNPTIDMTTDITVGIRRKSPWLKMTSAGQPHFGAYVFVQDVNLTGTFGQSWDLFYTYYFMVKGMN